MSNITYLVESILKDSKECRDNDNLLIEKVSLNTVLKPIQYARVIRARAELQQFNPLLRGEKYKLRQKYSKIRSAEYRKRKQELGENLTKVYGKLEIDTRPKNLLFKILSYKLF